jgi:ornithine carbamoyltransferase
MASGASLRFTASADEAVQGVDFIYAEAWASSVDAQGVSTERLAQLMPYQVNAELLLATRNPAVKVLHRSPLPRESGVHRLEVTDEVFESAACLAVDQVENRVHTIKALLVATLA